MFTQDLVFFGRAPAASIYNKTSWTQNKYKTFKNSYVTLLPHSTGKNDQRIFWAVSQFILFDGWSFISWMLLSAIMCNVANLVAFI